LSAVFVYVIANSERILLPLMNFSQSLCQENNTTELEIVNLLQSKLDAKDVLPNIKRIQAAERAGKKPFLSLVTLTFDLDLQTRPSEGPNTSSV